MSEILLENQAINPPVLLSPLAGITDLPFRNLVKSFGAGLVVSEMIASHEILHARPNARARAQLGLGAKTTSVQIAGCDGYLMAECAKFLVDMGVRIIDINMGCPAKTVTNGKAGSALMKTPDLALSLIESVVKAVVVPVTLKTRLGWDSDSLNAAFIAKRAEESGVKMITIHGRTRCQFYKGSADWAAIKTIKKAVNIPVIANGDIIDVSTARKALFLSGADGVMIGRAVQGKPWLLAQVAHEIYGATPPLIPKGNRLRKMIINHYTHMLDFYGTALGLRMARKHLGWYMDALPISKEFRHKVQTTTEPTTILAMINDFPDEICSL